jgi:hypothetical protein
MKGDYSPTTTGDDFSPIPSMMSTHYPQYQYPAFSGTNLSVQELQQMSSSDIEVESFEDFLNV